MRRLVLVLIVLACPALARPQEEPPPEKVYLALNTGGHTAPIRKVLFRPPHGKELITVSEDKTVGIWDVAHGKLLRVLRPPIGGGELGMLYAGAVSPDGQLLAVAGVHSRPGGDHPIYVISLTEGAIKQTLPGHPFTVTALAFSPDGKRLASGDGHKDGHGIRVWDLKTGKAEPELKARARGITALVFNPKNPNRLASASSDRTVRVWDLALGREVGGPFPHPRYAACVAWSPDGKTLASGGSEDARVLLWDPAATGKDVQPRRADLRVTDLHDITDVFSVEFSADSTKLLATWDVVTDSKTLACLWGGTVFDLQTGQRRLGYHGRGYKGTGPRGTLAAGGHLAVTAGGNQNEAFLWRVADAPRLAANKVEPGQLPAPRWLKRFAGGEAETAFSVGWKDLPAGTVPDLQPLIKEGKLRADTPVPALAWGEADPRTGAAGRKQSLQQVFLLSEKVFGPARAEPDDNEKPQLLGQAPEVFFEGFQEGERDKNGTFHVQRDGFTLDLPAREEGFTVHHGGKAVHADYKFNYLAGVRCGTLLAEGKVALGYGGRLQLYDGKTGKLLHALKGHPGRVLALTSSPKGNFLLVAFADQTLRVWNLENEFPILSLYVAGSEWVAWTPRGYYDATPGGERVMGWHVDNGPRKLGSFHEAKQFRKTLYRPDVVRRVVAAGDVGKALAAANKALHREPAAVEVADVLPPTMAAPTVTEKAGKVTVEATAEAAGEHALESLQLLVDGRPYLGEGALFKVPKGQGSKATATWEVTDLLPGDHQFSVLAQSAVSKAVSDPVPLTYAPAVAPPPAAVRGRLYVLAIGINEYRNEDLKLKSAKPDAEEIAKLFQDKDRQLPEVPLGDKPRVLTDEQATRAGILEGLEWLKQQMKDQDVAVISYSGHGEQDDKGHFAMLPVEFDADKWDSTTVSGDELKKQLSQVHGKVLVLLDACHSGAIARSAFADDLTRTLADDDCGVAVMCAAMSRQTAGESVKVGHGFFTKAVLEGLKGEADYDKDGKVQLDELDAYVSRAVRKLSKDQQRAGCAKPPTLSFFDLVAVPEKK